MIIDVIIWSVLGLTVAIFAYLILENLVLFPHKFVLRMPSDKGNFVISTKAKEIKDKAGVPKWRLLYKKTVVPVPPEDSKSITKSGKFHVEGWLMQDGQIQYERHKSPDAVQVATTNQRIQLAAQYIKAEKDRRRGWADLLGNIALPLGFGFFIVIIVIFGMTQWTELNKPGLQYQETQLAIQTQLTEQARIMQEIRQDVTVIGRDLEVEKFKNPEDKEPPN